jgi:hypothetical protein
MLEEQWVLAKHDAIGLQRPRTQGTSIKGQKGKFRAFDRILTDKGHRKVFNDKWLPELLRLFTEDMGGTRRLRGSELSPLLDGDWVRCESCKSVHRPVPNISLCLDCGSDQIRTLDPDRDEVFLARKGYYRNPVMGALADPPEQPMALIAAEHTAQLNSPQNEDVFSKAEENELLFQRQGTEGVTYEADAEFKPGKGQALTVPILATVSGKQYAIALSGPLTPDVPADDALGRFVEKTGSASAVVVNELLVRGNLPAATRSVQEQLGLYD